MKFRPCIDIHNGKVKQIVGGSLTDVQDQASENFVSEQDASFYAELYKKAGIKGGHVILLNGHDSPYYESTKEQLKTNHEIGLMLSNRSALAIVDNKYKVILSEDSSFSPYVIKAYWDQGKYKEARLDNTLEYKSLEELLSKNLS